MLRSGEVLDLVPLEEQTKSKSSLQALKDIQRKCTTREEEGDANAKALRTSALCVWIRMILTRE
eukprot:gene12218-8407_t